MYNNDNFTEITPDEFRESGFLWLCNTILHAFGLCLMTLDEGKDHHVRLIVGKTKWRGFGESNNARGYARIAEYLRKNGAEIQSDSDANYALEYGGTIRRDTLIENIKLMKPEELTKENIINLIRTY